MTALTAFHATVANVVASTGSPRPAVQKALLNSMMSERPALAQQVLAELLAEMAA